MTRKILHANGPVNDALGVGISVAGTDPLSDNDDGTYIACPYTGIMGFTVGLEPLVGYQAGDPISLHLRVGVSKGGPPLDEGEGQVFIATDSAGAVEIGGFSDGMTSGFGFNIPVVAGTVIENVVVPLRLTSWPTSLATLVAALEAGAYLDFNYLTNGNNGDVPGLFVFEAWVEVGLPGRRVPDRLVFPRTDTRRVFPPPNTQQFGRRSGSAAPL